jgi:hypothetical protein
VHLSRRRSIQLLVAGFVALGAGVALPIMVPTDGHRAGIGGSPAPGEPQPPDAPWVRSDGSIDVDRAPEFLTAVGRDGQLITQADGTPLTIPSCLLLTPAPPTADEHTSDGPPTTVDYADPEVQRRLPALAAANPNC